MKKVIVLLAICLCGFTAFADFPLNIGIHGGVSSNRIKVKDIPYEIKNKAHSGFMVGAFCRVNLGTLYLEPSLNFSQKKSVIEAQNLDSESTIKINSFDIPLMVGENFGYFHSETTRLSGSGGIFSGKNKKFTDRDFRPEYQRCHLERKNRCRRGCLETDFRHRL